MRVWIDILTPKQTLFFSRIAEKLHKKGVEILITIRDFRETVQLAEKHLKKFSPLVVGSYGGGLLINKLIKSLERGLSLVKPISNFNPDLTLSFCSPEAARVSFGLGIKHYSVSDIPQAEAVSKLTLPLSDRLYTPWIIPKRAWVKFGISYDKIYQYRGLDPLTWLLDYKFDRDVLKQLDILGDEYIVIRTVESYASYQLPVLRRSKIVDMKKLVLELVREFPEHKIIIIERYSERISMIRELFIDNDNVIVPFKAVDGPSLLKFASGFIGYGGTMTMEAALLGIPAISLRPGKLPYYLRFLIKKGLVKHVNSEKKAVRTLKNLINRREEIKRRARMEIDKMENPADYISKSILGLEG